MGSYANLDYYDIHGKKHFASSFGYKFFGY